MQPDDSSPLLDHINLASPFIHLQMTILKTLKKVIGLCGTLENSQAYRGIWYLHHCHILLGLLIAVRGVGLGLEDCVAASGCCSDRGTFSTQGLSVSPRHRKFRPVTFNLLVLSWGETFDSIWMQFWLSQLGRGCYCHLVGGERPEMLLGQPPTTKNYQNVSSAQVEKSCLDVFIEQCSFH